MALKVIGAGFGRTGTNSVCTALNQLGFPCYHMFEMIENSKNKSHLDFWRKVANNEPGTQHDWEQVFSQYSATVDNPACCVWRELMVAYPDAKVLLTVHPGGAEAWYQSAVETIYYFTEACWQFRVLECLTPFGRKLGDMCHKLIWQRSHQNTMRDREAAIAYYHRYIADVKSSVPADRLLVYSVTQGWKPLCDFLGLPIPGSEFPKVNDRADMNKRLAKMKQGAYALIGLGFIVLSALTYGSFRMLS